MTEPRTAKLNAPLFAICCLSLIGQWLLLVPPVRAQEPPPDARFGAVEAFRDPVAAAEAGVGWERVLFYWSELQPGGPEDWNGYHVPEEWLNLAAAQGREVVGLLKHTPAWATDGLPGCGVPRGVDLPVGDAGNLWATFVRRVVGMYAGRVDRWIIWNEPDIVPTTYGHEWCGSMEDYHRLLKVAYLAAHEANPDVVIHLAGMTTWHDQGYLRQFFALATQDPTGRAHGYYFDVVSLHIYFRTESVPTIINETQAAMTAYGLDKPIWVNETNAPPNTDPHWPMAAANYEISLEEQASFLLQSFSLALSAGAERVAVYKWLDNDLLPNYEPFGIIRPDFSRRPAFDAYRLITTHYAGAVSAREDRRALHGVVTLERGDLVTRVLWARTEADVTVSVPALASQGQLIDQTGAEQSIESVDGQYTLTLPGARCADKRGCIIGGATYLLVEETNGGPVPREASVAVPAETPAITMTAETPIRLPTVAAVPTETPTPTPVLAEMPSSTPAPTATLAATPGSTAVPCPSAPSAPPSPVPASTHSVPLTLALPAWSVLLGVAGALVSASLIGLQFKHRG